MRVFITDDSEIVSKNLSEVLSGMEKIEIIGQARDPVQAVESIKRLGPDVVILDIRMPGGSGIEVLETIKKNELSPVVIIFTNYPYPQYRKKCMELGAEYFFESVCAARKL